MIRLLVTGANGYIGRAVSNKFDQSGEFIVTRLTHDICDLTDPYAV